MLRPSEFVATSMNFLELALPNSATSFFGGTGFSSVSGADVSLHAAASAAMMMYLDTRIA